MNNFGFWSYKKIDAQQNLPAQFVWIKTAQIPHVPGAAL